MSIEYSTDLYNAFLTLVNVGTCIFILNIVFNQYNQYIQLFKYVDRKLSTLNKKMSSINQLLRITLNKQMDEDSTDDDVEEDDEEDEEEEVDESSDKEDEVKESSDKEDEVKEPSDKDEVKESSNGEDKDEVKKS